MWCCMPWWGKSNSQEEFKRISNGDRLAPKNEQRQDVIVTPEDLPALYDSGALRFVLKAEDKESKELAPAELNKKLEEYYNNPNPFFSLEIDEAKFASYSFSLNSKNKEKIKANILTKRDARKNILTALFEEGYLKFYADTQNGQNRNPYTPQEKEQKKSSDTFRDNLYTEFLQTDQTRGLIFVKNPTKGEQEKLYVPFQLHDSFLRLGGIHQPFQIEEEKKEQKEEKEGRNFPRNSSMMLSGVNKRGKSRKLLTSQSFRGNPSTVSGHGGDDLALPRDLSTVSSHGGDGSGFGRDPSTVSAQGDDDSSIDFSDFTEDFIELLGISTEIVFNDQETKQGDAKAAKHIEEKIALIKKLKETKETKETKVANNYQLDFKKIEQAYDVNKLIQEKNLDFSILFGVYESYFLRTDPKKILSLSIFQEELKTNSNNKINAILKSLSTNQRIQLHDASKKELAQFAFELRRQDIIRRYFERSEYLQEKIVSATGVFHYDEQRQRYQQWKKARLKNIKDMEAEDVLVVASQGKLRFDDLIDEIKQFLTVDSEGDDLSLEKDPISGNWKATSFVTSALDFLKTKQAVVQIEEKEAKNIHQKNGTIKGVSIQLTQQRLREELKTLEKSNIDPKQLSQELREDLAVLCAEAHRQVIIADIEVDSLNQWPIQSVLNLLMSEMLTVDELRDIDVSAYNNVQRYLCDSPKQTFQKALSEASGNLLLEFLRVGFISLEDADQAPKLSLDVLTRLLKSSLERYVENDSNFDQIITALTELKQKREKEKKDNENRALLQKIDLILVQVKNINKGLQVQEKIQAAKYEELKSLDQVAPPERDLRESRKLIIEPLFALIIKHNILPSATLLGANNDGIKIGQLRRIYQGDYSGLQRQSGNKKEPKKQKDKKQEKGLETHVLHIQLCKKQMQELVIALRQFQRRHYFENQEVLDEMSTLIQKHSDFNYRQQKLNLYVHDDERRLFLKHDALEWLIQDIEACINSKTNDEFESCVRLLHARFWEQNGYKDILEQSRVALSSQIGDIMKAKSTAYRMWNLFRGAHGCQTGNYAVYPVMRFFAEDRSQLFQVYKLSANRHNSAVPASEAKSEVRDTPRSSTVQQNHHTKSEEKPGYNPRLLGNGVKGCIDYISKAGQNTLDDVQPTYLLQRK